MLMNADDFDDFDGPSSKGRDVGSRLDGLDLDDLDGEAESKANAVEESMLQTQWDLAEAQQRLKRSEESKQASSEAAQVEAEEAAAVLEEERELARTEQSAAHTARAQSDRE